VRNGYSIVYLRSEGSILPERPGRACHQARRQLECLHLWRWRAQAHRDRACRRRRDADGDVLLRRRRPPDLEHDVWRGDDHQHFGSRTHRGWPAALGVLCARDRSRTPRGAGSVTHRRPGEWVPAQPRGDRAQGRAEWGALAHCRRHNTPAPNTALHDTLASIGDFPRL